MLISRSKDAIVITVENMWDWMDLFDNGFVDKFSFELDAGNLDVFFPDWDSYVNSDDPFGSLRMADLKAIKTFHILIPEEVPELTDLDGEGTYVVTSCEFEYDTSVFEETGKIPTFEDFLDYTGIATFKITPNHPVP